MQTFFSNRIYKSDLDDSVVSALSELMQEYSSVLHFAYADIVRRARDKAKGKTSPFESLYFKVKDKYPSVITYLRNTAIREAESTHSARLELLKNEKNVVLKRLSNTKQKLKKAEEQRNKLLKYKEMLINGNLVFDNKQRTFKKDGDKVLVFREKNHKRQLVAVYENEYLFECSFLQPKLNALRTRIGLLKCKINKLEERLSFFNNHYIPAVQFGTKRLRRQGIKDETKQQEYLRKRSNRFAVSGRADSKVGNFVFSYDTDSNSLKIYLGKSVGVITIPTVVFPYGQDKIINYYSKQRLEINQPITFSVEDKDKYYIIKCELKEESPDCNYSKADGVIGVDCNLGFYSVCETTGDGSLKQSGDYVYEWKQKTRNQTKYNIEQTAKAVVDIAVSTHKPLVIERLKFSTKDKLSNYNDNSLKNFNRNMFAYDKMIYALKARAAKEGVGVFEVNPVYTSFIAKMKYVPYYKRSIHQLAALVIGRRCLFPYRNEKLPKNEKTSSWSELYKIKK